MPKADLTVGLEHASGKGTAGTTVPNELLGDYTQFAPPRALPLSLHNGRLEGEIFVSTYDYVLSVQRVIAKEVQHWLAQHQVKTIYIEPGSP